jgi:hypothetical protein
MLYELVLLAMGVFLGQEYQIIPSVRIMCGRALEYFQQEQPEPDEYPRHRWFGYLESFIERFFTRPE